MPRVLVLGAGGQLGRAMVRTRPDGAEVVEHSRDTVDIRDGAAVARAVRDASPDAIVNCAAWTAVDDAEEHRDAAFEVNAEAPAELGRIAGEAGVRVVHVSTDYVFDGEGGAPYPTDARPRPLSVYGASKLEGERRLLEASDAAVVVRTSWVHSGSADNFVATAVRVLGGGTPMEIVDDQLGTPTRVDHLARALWIVAGRGDVAGRLHFTDAGVASWYDLGAWVLGMLEKAGRASDDVTVTPVGTDRFPRPARRPRCAVLDKHESWKTIGWTPPHWRVGVAASIGELLNA